eukprot:TRINITY_DN3792_c0_g2_i3.p1 TRINITY_DN3792_c0_g2~~TRINITY_DN3792_c0_g2_i3.p1  ORF type:complete len:468 (-),score=63.65 TRINITY_DN3792_c0_g2_i3:547-1950(-)
MENFSNRLFLKSPFGSLNAMEVDVLCTQPKCSWTQKKRKQILREKCGGKSFLLHMRKLIGVEWIGIIPTILTNIVHIQMNSNSMGSEQELAKPISKMNGRVSSLDGQAPDTTDYANYFCTYAYLYHQKDMLEDHRRTGAYYNAVMNNRACFEGKAVLDVGAGSGILAIFCAMAGARKVYAVEATSIASHAKTLVKSNNLDNVVEVIQGTVETVELPEKVDVIISEWMGYFLLRESMLDSVLVARDRFLKEGGSLFPSHARMFWCPIQTNMTSVKLGEYHAEMERWSEFVEEMQTYYNVDMSALNDKFQQEHQEYYLQTASWSNVQPSQVLGSPVCIKQYDLLSLNLEELKKPLEVSFELTVQSQVEVSGFCGYFDVQFNGSPQNPVSQPVTLTTAPDATGCTHWGQLSFPAHPPIQQSADRKLRCHIRVSRRKENQRLLRVELEATRKEPNNGQLQDVRRKLVYNID